MICALVPGPWTALRLGPLHEFAFALRDTEWYTVPMTNDTTKNQKGLFVYGTLRPGGGNYDLLADYRSVPATIRGRLYCVAPYGGYPVFVPGGDGLVRGDYFPDVALDDVPEVVWMEEGAGYNVERLQLLDNRGEHQYAWVFTWDRRTGAPIPSGDWRVR